MKHTNKAVAETPESNEVKAVVTVAMDADNSSDTRRDDMSFF